MIINRAAICVCLYVISTAIPDHYSYAYEHVHNMYVHLTRDLNTALKIVMQFKITQNINNMILSCTQNTHIFTHNETAQ